MVSPPFHGHAPQDRTSPFHVAPLHHAPPGTRKDTRRPNPVLWLCALYPDGELTRTRLGHDYRFVCKLGDPFAMLSHF